MTLNKAGIGVVGLLFLAVPANVRAQEGTAQERTADSRLQVIPLFGVGGRGKVDYLVGPELYVGVQLEAQLGARLRPVLDLSRWFLGLGCAEPCLDDGWNVEVGANYALVARQAAFVPYAGIGGGVAEIGDLQTSANARVGLDLWANSRLGVRLEGRYQHVFGADDPSVIRSVAGLRVRLR